MLLLSYYQKSFFIYYAHEVKVIIYKIITFLND